MERLHREEYEAALSRYVTEGNARVIDMLRGLPLEDPGEDLGRLIRGWLAYVSGPLSDGGAKAGDPRPTPLEQSRIRAAARVCCEVVKRGGAAVSFTAATEPEAWEIPYDLHIAADLRLVQACDSMLILKGWEWSKGCLMEIESFTTRRFTSPPTVYYLSRSHSLRQRLGVELILTGWWRRWGV